MEKNIFEKSMLVKSAGQIAKVSEDSIKEFIDKMDLLAWKMNAFLVEREDILELIGEKEDIAMIKDNYKNHIQFMASILQTPNPETLVDTVLWVFRTYIGKGYSSNYFSCQIDTWRMNLKENVSKKAFSEIFSIYDWFNVNIPYFVIAAAESLEKSKLTDNN